jgi:hypothetical protein
MEMAMADSLGDCRKLLKVRLRQDGWVMPNLYKGNHMGDRLELAPPDAPR